MTPITLKQLAARAGTSVRTVNRALKGQDGISQKKRSDILKLASELGYTPNIAARNLRMQRSSFVGILTGKGENSIHTRKLNMLVKKLEESNYFPLLSFIPQDISSVSNILNEWSGFVDYIVVLGAIKPQVLEELEKMPKNFILFDSEMPSDSSVNMIIDRSNGIKDGILQLAAKGRNKLARCGSIISREEGLEKAFKELHEKQKMEFIFFESKVDFEDGFAAGDKLIKSGADAVFFDTDRMALGFLKFAWKHGIKIPEDISVIGFDDDPVGTQSCPALSTVAHPIDEITDKIIELIEQKSESKGNFVFSTKFIDRESV